MEDSTPTWTELLGSNNWTKLLDPLDQTLRELILRCGDFCQATYDAFNNDQNSKYCGSSRYTKSSILHKVMLPDADDYEIASFLYTTARVSVPEAFLLKSQSRESWDRESNWIGYVAVTSDGRSGSTGRREIYVALRGTTRNYEWIDILGAELVSAEHLLRPDLGSEGGGSENQDEIDGGDEKAPKVMKGWLSMYTSEDPKSPFTKLSMRTQIRSKIDELLCTYRVGLYKLKFINWYTGEELSVTFVGHSLGASLSVLAAFDVAENGFSDIPVSAFVFECPQVGNKAFNDRISKLPNLRVLHIRNTIDLIPHYPGWVLGYVDSGTELVIDTRKSPRLKDSKHTGDWHNLQAMLHVVAGWNGEDGEFDLRVKRSVALVNKSCEFLKDELMVPGSWWVEKNKGMVRDEDGEWVLAPPEKEDLPVPEF